MPNTRLVLCAIAATSLACSGKEAPPPPSGAEAIAQVAAAKSLPTDKYSSPTSGFDLELPGVWKGRYRATEKADSRRLCACVSRAVGNGQTPARLVIDSAWRPDTIEPGAVAARGSNA